MLTQSGSITKPGYLLSYFAISDTGLVRAHNEDAYLIIEKDAVFCVADGAGGHKRGDVASKLTLKGIRDVITGTDNKQHDDTIPLDDRTIPVFDGQESSLKTILVPAIHYANELCRNATENNLASTIVSYQFTDDLLHIAHVGDSRAYSFYQDNLCQLTEDHSLVRYLYKQGEISEEEMRTHPKKNVILRAIGVEDTIKISHNSRQVQLGALYILCSDGLTGMLSDPEITELIKAGTGNLENICTSLLEAANKAGGRDNITIMVIKVE